MKKIFTFACALFATLALSAAETTIWTGNEPISWNPNEYSGSQYEINSIPGIQAGDTIIAHITPDMAEPQYAITYKAGDSWSWTDLAVTVGTNELRTVVAEAAVSDIAERGLIFRGQGYILTAVGICKKVSDPTPDPDPQPAEEYKDTEVWSGNMAISWNPEEYVGAELDTYNVRQDMLAGVAKDDSIKIYYSNAIEGAQFALTYKAGESWSWTDLTISQHNGFYAYKVASNEIAKDIADHGLVIRGQGYHAIRIVIGKPKSATGMEDVQSDKVQSTKILRNGQVLILKAGKTYNALGQEMK
jgi:uncharacterized protein YfiM (DUF2279 family)